MTVIDHRSDMVHNATFRTGMSLLGPAAGVATTISNDRHLQPCQA